MMVLSLSRIKRQYVVILQFDLENLIEVQDGFVCVADLETLKDHPCDSPSREKQFFFLCSFFKLKTLLLEPPVMVFLRPPAILRIRNLEVGLQLCPVDRMRRLQIGNRLCEFNLVDPYQLAHEETSLLKYFRQILKFLKSGKASGSSFSPSFF